MTDITSYIGTYSETKKTWRKRFAGIANDALTVYKIDGSDDIEDLHLHMKHVDTFETVQGCTDTVLPESIADRPYAFCLRLKNKKAFFFDCRTEELLHEWMNCIQKYVTPEPEPAPENNSLQAPEVAPRRRRKSVLVEGMKMWKDSSVYQDLIDGLSATQLESVEDLKSPALLGNAYILSFLESRSESINRILSTKPENAKVAYILLDFIKNLPATQYVNEPSKNRPPPILPKKPSGLLEHSKSNPDMDTLKKKPRRLRPKKNMKKIFGKLAKTASGRNVFETAETKRTNSSSSLTATTEEDDMEERDPQSSLEVSVSQEENGEEEDEQEERPPSPVRIDFASIEQRRGNVLSNPRVKRSGPPLPPPKPKIQIEVEDSGEADQDDSAVREEDESTMDDQNAEEDSVSTPQNEESNSTPTATGVSPAKRKLRRRKRAAPTRSANATVEKIEQIDNERDTLTKIERLDEETVPEEKSTRKPMGIPMMGFGIPPQDLRSALKKRNVPPPLPQKPASPAKSAETSSPSDFRSVLKKRDEENSASSDAGTPPALPPKSPRPSDTSTNDDNNEPSSEDPSKVSTTTPSGDTNSEEQKKPSPRIGVSMLPPDDDRRASTGQIDFRSVLKNNKQEVPTPEGEQKSSSSIDFRSVLKKRQSSELSESKSKTADSSPKQMDFRSVLKKRQSTSDDNSSEGDVKEASTASPGRSRGFSMMPPNSSGNIDFRSVLKKRDASPSNSNDAPADSRPSPQQMDFRSVLRKTKPVEKPVKKEVKQMDFRSVLKKRDPST